MTFVLIVDSVLTALPLSSFASVFVSII